MIRLFLKSYNKFNTHLILISCLISAVALGCNYNTPVNTTSELTIYAAASLQDSYNEISQLFMETYPKVQVNINFAGSQKLMTQISHGAKADIYASADMDHIANLGALGLSNSDPIIFARNKLAIVVHNKNKETITRFPDLTRQGVKIVLAHPSVPAGKYTTMLINNISYDSYLSPETFQKLFYANVVSYEDSVKSVLMKTVLGEADVGIVYKTDSQLSHAQVNTSKINIPEILNVTGIYGAVTINSGFNQNDADIFLQFIQSERSKKVFEKYGFDTE